VKFALIDRISELESGKRVVAHKALSLAEEYLADHFPAFPVLPGVLMLEAMTQACAWVVREALDFEPSVVVLKEARNVTYKSFVSPGEVLTIEGNCRSLAAGESEFAAVGRVGDREVVKARLVLRHLRLAEQGAAPESVDDEIRNYQRAQFRLIYSERTVVTAG